MYEAEKSECFKHVSHEREMAVHPMNVKGVYQTIAASAIDGV